MAAVRCPLSAHSATQHCQQAADGSPARTAGFSMDGWELGPSAVGPRGLVPPP